MEIGTIIALVIALAAVFVGPTIQWKIAKQQIRAQLVSANRQKCVEELKAQIIDYFSSAALFGAGLARSHFDERHVASMNRAQHAIVLYLDPSNELDSHLGSELENLSTWLTGIPLEESEEEAIKHLMGDEFEKRELAVCSHARAVINRERELIQRGE